MVYLAAKSLIYTRVKYMSILPGYKLVLHRQAVIHHTVKVVRNLGYLPGGEEGADRHQASVPRLLTEIPGT